MCICMPRFAANITTMFNEVPFMERFKAAAGAGFKAVEFLFPYDYSVQDIKKEVDFYGLKVVLFNMPAGNWEAGDRGIAANPDRQKEFQDGVDKAIEYAVILEVPQVNCLAGKKVQNKDEEEQYQVLVANLRHAAEKLAKKKVKTLIEYINVWDMPGFFLPTAVQALNVIKRVEHANVYLQLDIYHASRNKENVTEILINHLDKIAHIQIADHPGRHQPGTGEINYKHLLAEFDRIGYKGYVSMEYIPVADTSSSLQWISEYGFSLS
jgi:hydroxypyruvate isomerase